MSFLILILFIDGFILFILPIHPVSGDEPGDAGASRPAGDPGGGGVRAVLGAPGHLPPSPAPAQLRHQVTSSLFHNSY